MNSDTASDPRTLLSLARRAIRCHLAGTPVDAEAISPGDGAAQACFVSLKTRAGERLRGCMGTLEPSRPTLEEEVVANSLAAATRDPRFSPVEHRELNELSISIDLLSRAEPVADATALDPARYGLIVRAGERCGVLLPALTGVDTAERQIAICREKAGIGAHEPIEMERFTVKRVSE